MYENLKIEELELCYEYERKKQEEKDWNDDLFNGSLEECIEYCKDKNIKVDGENARIMKICLDENGSINFWEECVDDVDSVECKDFLMDEQL